MAGTLRVGTSGFAYAAWSPRFYPAGLASRQLLAHYATRLSACELNNTFYQQPRPERITAWLAATPGDFRFAVKAQRGGSYRAFAGDPVETVGWLTAPYRHFGDRLASVLFRVPDPVTHDDARLAALLAAWPADVPLALEFQHPSWRRADVHARLAERSVAWCVTDVDEADEPPLDVPGPFAYVRLRRLAYADDDLGRWAERVAAVVLGGRDAYVFFRHDEAGETALMAEAFGRRVADQVGASRPGG